LAAGSFGPEAWPHQLAVALITVAGVRLLIARALLPTNWVLATVGWLLLASRPAWLRRKLGPVLAGEAPSTRRRPMTLSVTCTNCRPCATPRMVNAAPPSASPPPA